MSAATVEHALIRGEGFDEYIRVAEDPIVFAALVNRWALAALRFAAASCYAHSGRNADAVRGLAAVLPAIEHGIGSAPNYTVLIHLAADILWTLERTDHVVIIERNLREKTIAPDFRYPHADGRLALARLCALQRRHDEAAQWFAKARAVLDEQGARPLRAIADFDEACTPAAVSPAIASAPCAGSNLPCRSSPPLACRVGRDARRSLRRRLIAGGAA